MVGELEAVGDAVTGGIAGRAVEPKAGEIGDDGHTHETDCLNCGTRLSGDFCHACGQHAHVHRTLTAFFHDFLHGALHFEGKVWRTLPLLAWKPGELTRRYVDGQRASFVSPVALFLFSVFLMFAAVSLLGLGDFAPNAKADLAREVQTSQRQLAKAERRRAEALKAGQPAAKFDERITELRTEISAMQAVQSGDLSKSTVRMSAGTPDWIRDTVGTAARNPELVAYKVKTNAYKFSWLIIPLSVPFVWLLFPFSRRFHTYDHTVFVTYSLCFMMLLVVAGAIFQAVGLATISGLLWLLPPFHMYRQLKGAYRLGRWGALWRATLLTRFAFIVISLFAAVLVGMGTYE